MSEKNSPKIVPLSSETHKSLKIRELGGFEHVKSAHMVPVTAHEFARLGAEYPIVFVKNSENDKFQSVALLGLKTGENLFLDGERWKGIFVPGSVRNHPFVLAPSPQNNEQLMVGLIENSPLVSEEEGINLFTEAGEESDYLKAKKESLANFLESDRLTHAFVNELAEKELLVSQTITVNAGEEKINLSGLYMVDEKKLGELSDEEFASFRKRGFLPALYAQLGSLHQLTRLARLQAEA